MPSDNNLIEALAPIKARPALAARGFIYDPCAFPNAEELDQLNDPSLADEILQDLFVEYPNLDIVLDTRKSSVLLAASGDGKTATLLRLKENLVAWRQEFSRVWEPATSPKWPYRPFVVVYNSFHEISLDQHITLEHHLRPFLNAVAHDMWLIMTHHGDYPPGFYKLSELEKDRTRRWWWAFLHHYLLSVNLSFEAHIFPKLYNDYKKATDHDDPLAKSRTFLSVLQLLEKRIQLLGFDGLFILIDNVDGHQQSRSVENIVALVRPILDETSIFSRQRIRWKFFLPGLLEDLVRQSQGYQRRGLKIVIPSWERAQLVDLLQRRFNWASKGRFVTIDDLSVEALPSGVSMEHQFITLVLEQSEGRPRTAIYLLDKLLEFLDGNGFLTWSAWQEFQEREQMDVSTRGGSQPRTVARTVYAKERSGISPDLNERLRIALKACGPFDSDRKLRNVFVHELLKPWQDNIPEANSVDERVDGIIAFLLNKRHREGTNALVILLRVLSQRVHPQDDCYGRLVNLANAMEHEFDSIEPETKLASSYNEVILALVHEISVRIRSLEVKVDRIDSTIPELHEAIILYYDESQVRFMSQIIESVDSAHMAELEKLLCKLDDIQTNQIPRVELEELLFLVKEDLMRRREQGQLLSEEEEVLETIKNPEIDFKHKLKVTLPLFFFPLVVYETEVELSAGSRSMKALLSLLDKIPWKGNKDAILH